MNCATLILSAGMQELHPEYDISYFLNSSNHFLINECFLWFPA